MQTYFYQATPDSPVCEHCLKNREFIGAGQEESVKVW